jgi:glycine oxidase
MSEVKGLRVVVAGAGAIGSVSALILARRGAHVTLADPAEVADNASGVAAGMLAPVSEALLDPVSSGHLPLMREAREAWDRLLPDLASSLDRSGAVIEASAADDLLARARAVGADLKPIGAEEARRLCPGLQAEGPFLFTPEDGRLEPRPMLAALHAALREAGGELVRSDVAGFTSGRAQLTGRPQIAADILIRATGPGPGLTPIKGQILRFAGAGPSRGVVVRGEGIYIAPSADGAVAGATMEEGLSDRRVDAEAVSLLRARALRLFPALATADVQAVAGVRAATPDGLPLVGPDAEAGVLVARGARRNGWLLAPLIAQVLLERLGGGPRSAAALAFDPARFH